MGAKNECPLCKSAANHTNSGVLSVWWEYACPRCGRFRMDGGFVENMLLRPETYEGKLHLLSGLTKTHFLRTGKPLMLTHDHLEDQLASALVPRTPAQCVDRLILNVRYMSREFGDEVELKVRRDWPVAFAQGPKEFESFIGQVVAE